MIYEHLILDFQDVNGGLHTYRELDNIITLSETQLNNVSISVRFNTDYKHTSDFMDIIRYLKNNRCIFKVFVYSRDYGRKLCNLCIENINYSRIECSRKYIQIDINCVKVVSMKSETSKISKIIDEDVLNIMSDLDRLSAMSAGIQYKLSKINVDDICKIVTEEDIRKIVRAEMRTIVNEVIKVMENKDKTIKPTLPNEPPIRSLGEWWRY